MKMKIKQSYRVGENIQIVGYTHCSRTIKKVTQLKHSTCDEDAHNNDRSNINYNDNNYTYNCKPYSEYYNPRMKKRSTIYEGHIQTATECVSHGREREAKRKFVSSHRRNKFSPYKQVSYTVKTNVDLVSTRYNEAGKQYGNGTRRRLCYTRTRYVLSTTNHYLA